MATYWVDPEGGNDTNSGTKASPWKSINHSLLAGDVVKVKKSSLSAVSWTVSGTHGQRDLTASSDPSGDISAGDVIKVDGEYYIVRGISGNTIQTYKPFLGSTGSGKTAEKVGVFDIGSTYWQLQSSGSSGNDIQIKGGYDWSTENQDGETFIRSVTTYALFISAKSYWTIEKINPIKSSSYPLYVSNGVGWSINNILAGIPRPMINSSNSSSGCRVRNIEIQTSSSPTIRLNSNQLQENIDVWGYGTGAYLQIGSYSFKEPMYFKNLRINGCGYNSYCAYFYYNVFLSDCEFGQVLANASEALNSASSGSVIYASNSKIGKELKGGSGSGEAPSYLISIKHGGVSGQNVTSVVHDEITGQNGTFETDTSIYKTSSPSIKFTPRSSSGDIILRFEIPVQAGTRTVSIYLRKNSSYNGSKRPYMRLEYFTGTIDTQWERDEVEMSDTNDSWVQVSKQITVGEDQVVRMSVRGRGTAGNFWCDDLEVN